MQNKWIWGCGLGCGTLILLVGLIGISVSQLGLGDKAKSAITDEAEKYYKDLKEKGKIQPEIQEPLSEFITLLKRPDTPLFAGLALTGIMTELMTNESLSADKKLPTIADFTELLKQKPEFDMDDVEEICKKHVDVMNELRKQARERGQEKHDEPQPSSTGS